MFLRWLLTTFPREMAGGWALLRPDLLLWVALAALVAMATMSLPAPGGEQSPPLLPFLISVLSGLAVTMLPAVLFTAQVEGRQLTWGPVLMLLARKAAPLVAYAIVAMLVAWSAEAGMLVAVSFAFGDTPSMIPISTVAGVVILVSILVRFAFLPFVVILTEREQIPAALWQWQRTAALAPLFWPLTAAARLTEGNRWRLVFYTVLGQGLPILAALVPKTIMLPVAVAVMLVLTVVQGALFEHYRRRCEETGVPAPTLPLDAASAA